MKYLILDRFKTVIFSTSLKTVLRLLNVILCVHKRFKFLQFLFPKTVKLLTLSYQIILNTFIHILIDNILLNIDEKKKEKKVI